MRAATVTVDAERVSIARSLASLARTPARDGGPLVVVSHRAWGDLSAELGGDDAAVRYLLKVAGNTGRPICVNLPAPDGSTTVFVAPRGWTDERLRGWAAGHHAELERAFGDATPIPLEDL